MFRSSVSHAGAIATAAFLLAAPDSGAGAVNTAVRRGAVSATFTRATTATTIGSTGLVVSVASGTARSYYSPDGTYLGYLAEGQRINICQRGEDFTTVWANVGTPTLSAGSTTLGALSLSTLGDDDGAALEGKTQTITHTGDAVKAYSIYVKKGTATSSVIRLRDTTASADRLLAAITWSGTTPVVTMTTGTDLTGTPVQHAATGVYRLMFATTAVTAANTNSLQLYPATDAALGTAATGTIEWGGVQAEDATFPSSLIQTPASASVTRNADVLSYTGVISVSQGTFFASAASFFNDPLATVILAATDANGRLLYQSSGVDATQMRTFDGVTTVSKTGLASHQNTLRKFASAWGGDLAITGDGLTVATGVFDGSMGATTDLSIGHVAGGNSWFGPISSTRANVQRLPNAVLQTLST